MTAATPSVPVLQPGQPGQPNATLPGSAAAPTTTPTASPRTRFYQDMIVHHAQALVMVRAVLSDLTDPQVEGIASRIGDEQEPEIGAMASWLDAGQSVPRGHEPQPHRPRGTLDAGYGDRGGGRAAGSGDRHRGRLFLTLMIRHHQGAISMVDDHLRTATDER